MTTAIEGVERDEQNDATDDEDQGFSEVALSHGSAERRAFTPVITTSAGG